MIKFLEIQSAVVTFNQLIRYVGVGLLSTAVHFAVFFCLSFLVEPLTASVAGGLSGALIAYLGNRSFTFIECDGEKLQSQRFFLIAGLHNLSNFLMMWVLLQKTDFSPYFSQLITTGFLFVVSFSIHRTWSFQREDIISR